MKIGIALSGGGVRSAAQLGIIKALKENGIEPSLYTGTSGGAIVATLLALGNTPERALELMKESQDVLDIAYLHILKGLFTRNAIQGVIKGNKLERSLDIIFDSKTLRDATCPLAVVTTEIHTGRQFIFSNRNDFLSYEINDDDYHWTFYDDKYPAPKLSEIVRSSCGLPGVFIPKQFGLHTFVDGGLVNNLPSDIAFSLGADRVISIELGYNGFAFEMKGIYSILNQAFDVIYHRDIENNRDSFDIKLNPKVYDVGILETHEIYECFNRGYEYGLQIVPAVLKELEQEGRNRYGLSLSN